MNVSWALLAVVLVLTVATYECRPRGRILGGQDSKAEVRPYMASIQQNGIHQCGGVLIADKWVLSAAHCATNSSNSSLNVMLGAISLSKPEKYKIVVKVLREIPHPLYNSTIKHHDLLLLEVRKYFLFKSPKCLRNHLKRIKRSAKNQARHVGVV
ncbi:hypothetical protein XENTR_v10001314 [Xenopus tropicalis]|nr:hypothetical protein XENTR_v10001314 [Xenopus tropicalis]